MRQFNSVLCLLVLLLPFIIGKYPENDVVFANLADKANYTCEEIVKWLGSEKHYSNDKKKVLFGLVSQEKCENQPIVLLKDVSFGSDGKQRTFFSNPKGAKKCSKKDDFVVVYLSNYSINNNFSHFLHGLVRLFCSLVDAKIIIWDNTSQTFRITRKFTIWLDEYFKLSYDKAVWLNAFGGTVKSLAQFPGPGDCIHSQELLYGSGCVRLLPPEKWFGYPGCRSATILPAFGAFMRQQFHAGSRKELMISSISPSAITQQPKSLQIAFTVRDSSEKTGRRQISNLYQIQRQLGEMSSSSIATKINNITFEHLNVSATVQTLAKVHLLISVHGAAMANMFFMHPGSAVIEIIPFPLCTCRSPDYFYGVGGFYHGSAIAQGIKHYHYCVPSTAVKWHKSPTKDGNVLADGVKCSWKHLHAVDSVSVNSFELVSLVRKVIRDLIEEGTIVLDSPIIQINPHVNG